MFEGQNKTRLRVLTQAWVPLARASNPYRRNSIIYPQHQVGVRPSSVADPSLSPRSRGQRHGTRRLGVAGSKRGEEESLRISNKLFGRNGERYEGKARKSKERNRRLMNEV
jgi:hypothetical protein